MLTICLNYLSFLEAKPSSTSPATMCPAYVWHNCTVYLKKIDLHSLLDSISKIFQKIFELLHRTCRLSCKPSVKKFSYWSNCMEYNSKVLWTTTKLKDIPLPAFTYVWAKAYRQKTTFLLKKKTEETKMADFNLLRCSTNAFQTLLLPGKMYAFLVNWKTFVKTTEHSWTKTILSRECRTV